MIDERPASPGDTRTVYTTCLCNCGSNSQCVLKAHVRNGIVTRVEPDDRYNPGIGREDEVLSETDLIKTRLQRRPCPRGLVFHKYLYRPDRLLYPLKRVPGTQRGEGKYARISWDEALTTIADQMTRIRQAYGPYSIITPYMPNETLERLFSFWGAGVDSWGWCSFDASRMMAHLIAGEKGWDYHAYSSASAPDMLAHAKLIVIWGYDPGTGSNGPGFQFAWFVKLARERGIPVIFIEPRYTMGAAVLADQWIPIKPGTDSAMFMAMAYVLFKEEMWDKQFVSRFVEPEGFAKWQDYVLGRSDGIAKTPQWAAEKCAVPADTIQALALLVGRTRPSWLYCHWGVSRKSRGEQTVRAYAALQAMLGYWGAPGGGPGILLGPYRDIPVRASWGPPGKYRVPKMYRSHYWAQSVLLQDQLKSGRLSPQQYMRAIGWRADPSLLESYRPKMLFWGGGSKPHASDHLVTACDSSGAQVEAMQRMEFIVSMHSRMTPTAGYADIILPAQDWMWEEKNITLSEYGGFECINYCPGVVKPPGEVRPWAWVYTQLAQKLGIDPRDFFKYYTGDENWERDWERYLQESYQGIEAYYRRRDVAVPAWEAFTRGEFINCDELAERPFTGLEPQIREGRPFNTASGRIELYSAYMDDEANRGKGEHCDPFGRVYDNLASDWGDLSPAVVYQDSVRGMDDPVTRQYPLMMLCPHGRYRVHYLFWEHPWLKEQVYRHRLWINVADAQARGIKEGDLVTAFNDCGKVVMRAYVTSRLMPGLIVIRHGGKYIPDQAVRISVPRRPPCWEGILPVPSLRPRPATWCRW